MKNKLILWAYFLGLTAVVFGAFGAHALENKLTLKELQSYKTATSYQMFHSLLLLLVASSDYFSINITRWVGSFLVVGIFLFSFSIYALMLDKLIGIDLGFLGPVTPVGGLCLIVSWSILLVSGFKKTKE